MGQVSDYHCRGNPNSNPSYLDIYFGFDATSAALLTDKKRFNLHSEYKSPTGTRIALLLNMDDKTLHFFHNGKFSSVFIYLLNIISNHLDFFHIYLKLIFPLFRLEFYYFLLIKYFLIDKK
jgi:hypothetical protein